MVITRKIEFSASHICRNPRLSEEENQKLFGPAANAHGHGHNYVVEVSLEGDPDPVTGMVLDLKELKQILTHEVLEPYDHRFLTTRCRRSTAWCRPPRTSRATSGSGWNRV